MSGLAVRTEPSRGPSPARTRKLVVAVGATEVEDSVDDDETTASEVVVEMASVVEMVSVDEPGEN